MCLDLAELPSVELWLRSCVFTAKKHLGKSGFFNPMLLPEKKFRYMGFDECDHCRPLTVTISMYVDLLDDISDSVGLPFYLSLFLFYHDIAPWHNILLHPANSPHLKPIQRLWERLQWWMWARVDTPTLVLDSSSQFPVWKVKPTWELLKPAFFSGQWGQSQVAKRSPFVWKTMRKWHLTWSIT